MARTEILKDEKFLKPFCSETWRGRLLNTDDDNFISRYLDIQHWHICLQFDEDAVVLTTLETDYKYLFQCARWARSQWRNNIRTVLFESSICRWVNGVPFIIVESDTGLGDILGLRLHTSLKHLYIRFWLTRCCCLCGTQV